MQAVRRRNDDPRPYGSADEARRGVGQAVVRFAMAEFPLALALAGALYWLTATDHGLDAQTQMIAMVGVCMAFVTAVAVLFWTILWPALQRKRAFDQNEKGR